MIAPTVLLRRYMMLTEAADEVMPRALYHGTSSRHIRSILAMGLSPPTHWGSLDIANYFARGECHDVGGRPVIIRKSFTEFHPERFQVDVNMLDFPVLIDIRGTDIGELAEEWEASKQGWADCLRIYESVIYDAPVAVGRNDLIR